MGHLVFNQLIISHDLLCLTVTNQIALEQRDSNLIPKFESTMDRCCQVLVLKLETLDTITFTQLTYRSESSPTWLAGGYFGTIHTEAFIRYFRSKFVC